MLLSIQRDVSDHTNKYVTDNNTPQPVQPTVQTSYNAITKDFNRVLSLASSGTCMLQLITPQNTYQNIDSCEKSKYIWITSS